MKTRQGRRDASLRVAILVDTGFYRDSLAEALPRWRLTVVDRSVDADVVLVDVAGSGGLGALRELATASPEMRLLALGVRDNDNDIVKCIEAGAIGYVVRDASLDDLADAVRHAVRDEPLASPRVIATLMRRVAALSANGRRGSAADLTSRELEVIELIEQGLSNKEIAAQLSIAVATVKNHVHSILEKLKVQRRGEAASFVRNAGPKA
jgi:two-component system, NarL family, nitrate/nitrite response regulator NarL